MIGTNSNMQSIVEKSPIQKIEDDFLVIRGIQLYIKRDDLIHPEIQGNKWRKLKYNLQEAQEKQFKTLLTFGGAYSNHIYATAAAAEFFKFKSIGIIRGEESETLSSTLQFAISKGMELHYMNRETYRHKDEHATIKKLQEQFGEFYLVPEGGTNNLALKGVAEIIDEIDMDYDYICTACGTGGTLAGLVAGLSGNKKAIGFSSLKGEDMLTPAVNKLVHDFSGQTFTNFNINFNYHFGGYAKVKPELIDFIKEFKNEYGIQLEPVYTGKMFYGLFDLIKKDYFPTCAKIIAVHTGGLQGLKGFSNYFSESDLGESV